MKKIFLTLPILTLNLGVFSCNAFESKDILSVDITEEKVVVIAGEPYQLEAEIESKSGKTHKASWKSTNEDIVKIDRDGVVTGVSRGSADIICYASANKKIQDTCHVTVRTVDPENTAFKKAEPSFTYHDLDSTGNVNSFGEQKVLVIPVFFSDDGDNATKANRDFINMSFFGTDEECGWRSFTGYYEVASYGQLHYSGHTSEEWYPAPYTKDEVRSSENYSQTITMNALKWFKDNNPDFDLTDYDENNDGYIDSLYIIYASDYDYYSSSLWGYRWSVFRDTVNTEGKKASAFSWFSLKFLKDVYNYGGVPENGSNTRVIIHEHGHMLGLADYYDSGDTGIDLVGSFDMQSGNVFDWNAFSKYSVGWIQPYYLDEEKMKVMKEDTIVLNPTAENGDFLILRNGEWNGSPFDEYVILELFNPEIGNNAYDYFHSNYRSIKETGFGVRIYHVDARMVSYNYYTGKAQEADEIGEPGCEYFVLNDNMGISSPNHNYIGKQIGFKSWNHFHLLHMLQKENENTFESTDGADRHYWTKDDLWQTGDTFTIGEHEGFENYGPEFFYKKTKFNDKSTFPYGVTFDYVSKDKAIITVTYLG